MAQASSAQTQLRANFAYSGFAYKFNETIW
jgi:hypothetical protein